MNECIVMEKIHASACMWLPFQFFSNSSKYSSLTMRLEAESTFGLNPKAENLPFSQAQSKNLRKDLTIRA